MVAHILGSIKKSILIVKSYGIVLEKVLNMRQRNKQYLSKYVCISDAL
jgi:hypothetical protein